MMGVETNGKGSPSAQPIKSYHLARIVPDVQRIAADAKDGSWGPAISNKLKVMATVLSGRLVETDTVAQLESYQLAILAAVTCRDAPATRAACAALIAAAEGREVPALVDPAPIEPTAPPVPAANDNDHDPDRAHDPDRDHAGAEGQPAAATTTPATGGAGIASAVELGEVVRLARIAKGISQQDVATAANVGRRFVVELEAGKATSGIGLVLAVCAAVGITVIASAA